MIQLAGFDVLKPDLMNCVDLENVSVEVFYALQPKIDFSKCRYCGSCLRSCPEKAIQLNRYVPSVTLIVSLCIGCGECTKGCDRRGISMQQKLTGQIVKGRLNQHLFISGELDEKSEFQIPLVNALIERLNTEATVICDFGPGTGNSVTAGLKAMDFAAIITNQEENWADHLTEILAITKKNDISTGVILNQIKNRKLFEKEVQSYCNSNSISYLGQVPFQYDVANKTALSKNSESAYSDKVFAAIWSRITESLPEFLQVQTETFK